MWWSTREQREGGTAVQCSVAAGAVFVSENFLKMVLYNLRAVAERCSAQAGVGCEVGVLER